MNVYLNQELEEMIQGRVRSGCYASASDVLNEALRLLERHDDLLSYDLDLPKKIEEGWVAAQQGNLIDGENLFEEMDVELSHLERTSSK